MLWCEPTSSRRSDRFAYNHLPRHVAPVGSAAMTQGGIDPLPTTSEPGALGTRFFARLIDGVLIGIVFFLAGFFLDILGNYWVTGLFSGLLVFAYFTVFEGTQGWTPGKK